MLSDKIIFCLCRRIETPSPYKQYVIKRSFAREVSTSIGPSSLPVNTVQSNIVLRGRGGCYSTGNKNSASVLKLLVEIVDFAEGARFMFLFDISYLPV